MTPNLNIIAGCNGAGKTTASYSVLPEILNCKEFVNADEIAKGLSPFQPEKASFESGRIMLNRINELLNQNADFAFETTLATRSYLKLIQKAKSKGYRVTLIFLWLKSPTIAKERVRSRVANGGHNIPDDVIERRYYRGLNNFFELFQAAVDYWLLIDNDLAYPVTVAEGFNQVDFEVKNADIWKTIKLQVNG